ncbi:MarR family winged helix-turn-helix transcriptional regulator [Limoniibacter endophyticus]
MHVAVQQDDIEQKEKLRLWVRLLRASRMIEAELRNRFAVEFNTTLPRFDVMAALDRFPDGMLMSDLSRYLLVSNGNVTGIIERLVQEGFVSRAKREGDKRTSIVSLTAEGCALFAQMADAHERWVSAYLNAMSLDEARTLSGMLESFRSNWEDHSPE